MADRGAGRVVGGRVGRMVAVAFALVASLFVGASAPGSVSAATDEHPEFILIPADLEHMLKQIQIAEAHAAGGQLLCAQPTDTSGKCVPDPMLPLGLRTVDGTYNNLEFNPLEYGSAHHPFPRRLSPVWRDGSAGPPGAPPNNPANTAMCAPAATCYEQYAGFVYDPEPRMISNLIVDQTTDNPAAVAAAEQREGSEIGPRSPSKPGDIFLPNTASDEELSAPFNAWFTFFGQFFDHGLDLVSKGGNGTVVIPLQPDDPLWDVTPPSQRFMLLSRATQQAGPDEQIGTPDDIREHNNLTTPFVDQNQTYTSHPSHQFFLREYVPSNGPGSAPVATGRLLEGANGGLATWNDIKTQAREVLGIALGLEPGTSPSAGNSDFPDVLNIPEVLTDQYGNFVPNAAGYPQLVTETGGLVAANPNAPISTANARRTGHAFLDDIAHGASPATDDLSGYDNVLLGEHFITGDGRGNENIGLTAVHHVFHSEHNRMAEWVKDLLENPQHELYTSGRFEYDPELLNVFRGANNNYQELMGEPLPEGPEPDDWSYEERIFQVAKFATEMQYQHLVFEEFARRVQPEIDAIVLNENSYDSTINPSIVAEFAHVVYRFGHSMLTTDLAREFDLDNDGARDDVTSAALLDAFLNPTAYLCPVPPVVNPTTGLSSCPQPLMTPDQAAGAIVNGTTNQTGNHIDEFVISTLRNNLLGLPLDLPAINMARARDAGVPGLQAARREFFEESGDPQLRPYTSWADFDLNLKNGSNFGRGPDNQTLVNFVAAYGEHPQVTGENTIARRRAAADLVVNGLGDFTDRINGTDRYSTAAAISAEHFSPGVPVAYITSGVNFPDAIAGGSAAAFEGGPILLTGQNSIPQSTQLELQRLAPERIVVLGGPVAVSDLVVDALGQLTTGTVSRMFGPDRYVTAAQISATVFAPNAPIVYVASGQNFPDALAAGAVAARDEAPMLLVRENDIPGAAQNELERLNPSKIIVIGGPGVISQNVQNQLAGFLAPGGTIQRLAGADRYATSAAISNASFPPKGPAVVYVATGSDFPDALSAGPVAGVMASAAVTGPHAAPLLLLPETGTIPTSVRLEIQRLAPYKIVILGGPGAVSADMELQLDALAPPEPPDRLAFMNSTGAWASQNGLTTTGLESIDLWVGGLAEVLDPFGGMLGTTFAHVFEEQLENLQFGDRFYYLFRNQGNQLFAGLENNSFASLIRRNTDATNVPADIFAIQDPYFDLANLPDPMPTGLIEQTDGCIRWDGDEHIEIHGTPAADCIIGGQGDDSLWGYDGDDRIEGGSGNDIMIAGDGDDIVTDTFGDDNLKGGWGNDALKTGPGVDDLVTASHDNDFIVLGQDNVKTVFAGTGNDIILGGTGRDNVFGGEGDDWFEGGPHADLLLGDNANQFQNDPNGGHDVIKGGDGSDDHDSDGGDDIMVGNAGGTDRYEGMMGFDWVTYYGEAASIDADMRFITIQRPDIQAIRDRYDLIEGISGGGGNDVIRGMGHPIDDLNSDDTRHLLTEDHLTRIDGLRELLRDPDGPGGDQGYAAPFMTADFQRISNILLGGGGSDLIEGRAGDDYLDGNAYLAVQLRNDTDGSLHDSAAALEPAVFAGTLNPGDISIYRSIQEAVDPEPDPESPEDFVPVLDTVVYDLPLANYTITDLTEGYYSVENTDPGEDGDLLQGTDIIRNFEVIQFGDTCVQVDPALPVEQWPVCEDIATVTLTWTGAPIDPPVEDDPAGITATLVLDPGFTATDVRFHWQAGEVGEAWDPTETPDDGLPDVPGGLVDTFIPSSRDATAIMRVVVTFRDGSGLFRSVASAPTPEIENINDAPVPPLLTPTNPVLNNAVKALPFTDEDGMEDALEPGGIVYQWQYSDNPNGPWTPIGGPTLDTGVVLDDPTLAGMYIGVVITFTDDLGTDETITTGTGADQIQAVGPVSAPG